MAYLRALPPELWNMVFQYIDDWEVLSALSIRPSIPLPRPAIWADSSILDRTILTGDLADVKSLIEIGMDAKNINPASYWIIGKFGYLHILEYLSKQINLKVTPLLMASASRHNQTSILDWCFQNKKIAYNRFAIDWASWRGNVQILQWWLDSKLDLEYTDFALLGASMENRVNVLQWWKESGLLPRQKCPHSYLRFAKRGASKEAVDWWLQSGLLDDDKEAFAIIDKRDYWELSGFLLAYSNNVR